MKHTWKFAASVICFAGSFCIAAEPAQPGTTSAALSRAAYLDPLIYPHRYKAGKNSFILQLPAKGQKTTLLKLDGSGSVRHIWTTWSVGEGEGYQNMAGQVILRVYLNGESQPAIEAPWAELCQAANQCHAEPGMMPAFVLNRSLNIFLPIYFEKGIRIEAEPVVKVNELFVQIDYRQTDKPECAARLASKKTADGIRLEYTGALPAKEDAEAKAVPLATRESKVPTGDQGITIPGPAILRRLTFAGENLDDLELQISWDGEAVPAVRAPLRYFFGGFQNAAVESEPGRLTTWFPMPFRKHAKLVLRGPADRQATVSYAAESGPSLPDDVMYFHALFREESDTVGYLPYQALQTEGKGHFVGVNLFDTGHNHGGGDTALTDPATDSPRLVHGINGEDYFAFAWHDTGRMNLLTGAPVHERRYRLHLENPYPFEESLRFTFGVFAGNHPKSVAFWYQSPDRPKSGEWQAADAPWNVLGPLAAGTALPDEVDARQYETKVPSHLPIDFTVRWEPSAMSRGLLDLTDHFRHFAMTRDGSGFLVGKSVMRLITYVHADEKRTLEARFGHDDRMIIRVNGKTATDFPGVEGFHPSPGTVLLEAGWNKLEITLENENNVDWRWNGLTLAIKNPEGLRFALKPE
jgi:hypothetical protein